MRQADAIELLDTRTFLKTRDFGGQLFHPYQRGDSEDLECETIQAEVQGTTLLFRLTGRHKSHPESRPWSHEYAYNGRFLVHWTDA